ncbi:MAG: DNA recombination protein RmuC [Acidimicrobiia bacterium]|nr:DNA recombination protein RmuC [Acidimicrobiia bacterium]
MVVVALSIVLTAAVVGVVVVLVASRVTAVQLERHLAAGSRESGVRDDSLRHELTGMAHRLERVTGAMADLRADRASQHGELLARVGEAHRVTEALRTTTDGLQRALASPQARGQWGERMCDDVLRSAGLIEGVNYVKQRTLVDGTRPDVTFLLPDDRLLHLDVKFPLAGYQRWCDAGTDRERADALAGFLRDVRSRVKELARPGYADETTVGFTVLFIPNESVYGFIHANDARLADDALAQRVVLCSPFTLFAVLGVIRQAADAVAVARGADEVLDVLAGFTKQWELFTEKLDALGRNLQTATNAYEQVNGARRRQLERQLDRVEDVRRGRGLEPARPVDGEGGPLREVSSW